jgi:hypothetical protein
MEIIKLKWQNKQEIKQLHKKKIEKLYGTVQVTLPCQDIFIQGYTDEMYEK